jgi:hypothetical protein
MVSNQEGFVLNSPLASNGVWVLLSLYFLEIADWTHTRDEHKIDICHETKTKSSQELERSQQHPDCNLLGVKNDTIQCVFVYPTLQCCFDASSGGKDSFLFELMRFCLNWNINNGAPLWLLDFNLLSLMESPIALVFYNVQSALLYFVYNMVSSLWVLSSIISQNSFLKKKVVVLFYS